jgi:hypothetical protein
MAMATDNTTSHDQSTERYDVLSTVEYKSKRDGSTRTQWTRIGVAFPHKDDEGFNVTLTALPLDGKLVIRKHIDREDSDT